MEQLNERKDSMREVSLPYKWPQDEESIAFYHKVALPPSFLNIDLIGSRLELQLECSMPTRFFINGRKFYDVPYWADTTSVPFALTDRLNNGDSFELVLLIPQGDGFGYFGAPKLYLDVLENRVMELDTFNEELQFALFLIQTGDVTEPSMGTILENAAATFDISALEQNQWDRVDEMIALIRAQLSPFTAIAKQYKIHLIGHAHIDLAYLWPMSEAIDVILRDFDSIVVYQ